MMNKNSLLPIFLVPSMILLIPAAAMLFKVDGWAWDAGSFIVAWVLMAGVGFAYKLVAMKTANLMYTGVLVIGVLGAAVARLESRRMAIALFTVSLAQLLVPVIALLVRPPDFSPGVMPVFGVNFFFVLLFAASALLFRHAAGKRL